MPDRYREDLQDRVEPLPRQLRPLAFAVAEPAATPSLPEDGSDRAGAIARDAEVG